jgi:cbb3-type cytochrome oxidase subunit 3
MNPEELPLRDIHLPNPVSWWPLAPGWWLLVGVMLAVIVWLFWRWKQQQRDEQSLALALSELERLQNKHGKDTKALLRELSVLLRRVAMTQYGRQAVSGLTGAAWVKFLDDKAGKPLFSGKLAHLLTEVPYRPETQAETTALLHAIRQWIKLQRGKSHV